MPVVIGAKPESSFSDPIGLLKDCHRRIERFLSVLEQVSAREGQLSESDREELERALTYFREAAPKHTADEEETLFPRLRAKAMLTRLADLEKEHERAEQLHRELDALDENWLGDRSHIRSVVAELVKLYREHIRIEEEEVFPAAATALEAEHKEMGREMAARRGIA